MEFTITWGALWKVLTVALIAYIAVQLWPLILLLIVALLIAITLYPILQWTRRRGWPDAVGIILIAALLASAVALFFGILIPTVARQGTALIQKLPNFQADVVDRMPHGAFRDAVNKGFESASFSNPEPLMRQFMSWGSAMLEGLGKFLLTMVFAVYLVADGERVSRWLLAFLPEEHRMKGGLAFIEIRDMVRSYTTGQLITSSVCGVYVFSLLSILHVPDAVVLAVIAAVFDILPIIGFFLSVIPSTIVAFSVSPTAAALVVVCYGVYHLLENYFIVPKVYGDRLRLSSLTVLVSCAAAVLVAGIVGALVILPIVASYPIIERIWLRRHLEDDTVVKHTQIDAEEHQ